MPSINLLYGEPPPDEPGDPFEQAPGQPPPDQVLDKYIAAIGGAQRVAALTSFTGKGTYIGFDDADKAPLEIVARAPGHRTAIVHGLAGDTTTTFDGRSGWIAAPPTDRPVPLLAVTGQELEGLKLEAELLFPSPAGRRSSPTARSAWCRAPPRAAESRRCASTRKPVCSCGWCATPSRRSGVW